MEVTTTRTVEYAVHFRKGRHGKQHIVEGVAPEARPIPEGRVPRIARLMALAIHMDDLLRQGTVKNYSEMATLGRVTRARITQIMSLINLAPDIQESILFLPRVKKGRDPIRERKIKQVLKEKRWDKQRTIWRRIAG